jgi:uncharacterized protein (TIGR02444 family)
MSVISSEPQPGLWEFSLRFYSMPDVATACLAAQDHHGADVNLLLWVLWLGLHGRALDAPTLAQAQEAIAAWCDAVILPLRRLRRHGLPSALASLADDALRDEAKGTLLACVKGAELHSERVAQALLAALPLPPLSASTETKPNPALVGDNLRALLPPDALDVTNQLQSLMHSFCADHAMVPSPALSCT